MIQAYEYGLFGRKYTWFIKGLFRNKWWLKWAGTDTCTPDQVQQASNGYFCATYSVFGRTEQPTITGIVSFG